MLDNQYIVTRLILVNAQLEYVMDNSFRNLRLRQLDNRLVSFNPLRTTAIPRGGWLREIRTALRMSTAQLGRRLGLTRQAVSAFEHAEAAGSITLKSLRRAADAIQCDLVYALVPRDSLEALLDRQAQTVAAATVKRASHTMSLERQEVSEQETAAQLQELSGRLRSAWSRNLWDGIDR